MKMTFQPKKRQRSKVHGFRKRMSTAGGRKVLASRRAKGRKKLSAYVTDNVTFLYMQLRGWWNMKMKDYTSLKKNIDFQKVYKEGKSKANKYLVMYVLPNDLGINRLGISVSKKVGNSVVRHHLTRLIRESYRLNSNMFNSSLDIVVVVRTTARDKNYHSLESALMHLGKIQNILQKNTN